MRTTSFNQIFFNLQIEAVAGRRYRQRSLSFNNRQPQALERIQALGLGERHANHFDRARYAQSDRCRLGQVDLCIVHGAADGIGRAANIDDELGNALDVFYRLPRVYTALKTVTSIG